MFATARTNGHAPAHFTDVQQAVLACIRIDRRDDALIPDIVTRRGFRWNELTELSLRQGVMPAVYERLREVADDAMPQQVRDEFQQLYLVNAVRNRALAAQLVEIVGLLEGAGIQCAAFKGPALAAQVYGGPSARQSSWDLDVFVAIGDVSRARRLLLDRGYADGPYRQLRWLNRAGIEVCLHPPAPSIHAPIELHWGLGDDSRRPLVSLISDWLVRGSRVSVDGLAVPTLSPTDGFVALCLHAGLHHAWSGLRWICDLGRALHNVRDKDALQALDAAASECRARRVVALGSALVRRLFDERVDASDDEQLVADLADRLHAKVFNARGANTIAWKLRMADDWRPRSLELAHLACVPTTVPWETAPPPVLYPALCAARPIAVIGRRVANAVRLT